jgi:class 3 adenylate cyclase
MEPRIEYVKTADGVSIACWALGEGVPLVQMPPFPFTHVRLERQMPELRRWLDCLANCTRLVRYDGRGAGLSDRNVTDFSLEAQISDLEAVVDELSLERFALFATGEMGPTAIAYAAGHPERVSHLILWCSWARRADVSGAPRTQTLRALLEHDWELYTENAARVFLGWKAEGEARQLAAFYRECITPEVLRQWVDAIYDGDVTGSLRSIQCPTLVLQRRQMTNPSVEVATRLAGGIRDARLVVVEGTSPLWVTDDVVEDVLLAVGDFLGLERLATSLPPRTERRAYRTILFTDVEGSTSLTQRLGDSRARQVLREHERITRECLLAHSGREMKTSGDGFMASFTSAARALECAIAMQRAFAARNETADVKFEVRIGVNAGEPITELTGQGEEDLFGTPVIMAQRIMAKARGGEILTSDTVRGLVAGSGFLLSDRGEEAMRGFEDPVRLLEVAWKEHDSP